MCWCASGRCRGSLDHPLISLPCAVWIRLGQTLNVSFLSFSGCWLQPPKLMTHWADNILILRNIRGYTIPLCPVTRRSVSGRAQNWGKARRMPGACVASLLLKFLRNLSASLSAINTSSALRSAGSPSRGGRGACLHTLGSSFWL